MSTFLGLIDEIPGISVDRFNDVNLNSSLYFLSHCHTDHMKGLSVDFFHNLSECDKYLYCSPISKAFLLGIYPGSPSDRIIEIESTVPKTIEYNIRQGGESLATYLTVTTSPAGHCPGSVMFVFTKEAESILYTGDFRIDPKDLPKLNPLNDKICGKNRAKYFAAVYMDTTFLNNDYPAFPTRKESCEEICRAIKTWLQNDQRNAVVIECSANYGPEYLFMEIARLLKTRIHVKDKVYSNYMRIEELADCVTGDGSKARIHACASKMTRDELQCRSDVDPKYILTIVPSALRWRGKNLSTFSEFDDRNKQRLYVCCSMHASFNELRDFVDYFKPGKIVPCVCPNESIGRIYYLIEELMNYQPKSSSVDKDRSDIKLPLLIRGKQKPNESFKSKYFSHEDDDDDDC